MFELKGRLYSLTYDREQKPLLTFELEDDLQGGAYDELIGQDLIITADKYKAKRSKNANAFMWELCTQLAKYGYKTKDDIYKEAVKAVGIFRLYHLPPAEVESFCWVWEHNGVAWLTEIQDFDESGELVEIRAYFGSSTYNSAQMKRLIDYLLEDCRACGINVDTKEMTALLNDWRGAMRKDEENG